MGRDIRVEFPGATYHITQRGNNQEAIFARAEDKSFFVRQLARVCDEGGAKLFAYAVMSNHYHLLIRTDDAPISQIMKRLNALYAQYYNRVSERTGHVFQGRYKSFIVKDGKYLTAALRYIHLNPLKAGLCTSAEQYPWSSDRAYRRGEEGMVSTSFFLSTIGQSKDSQSQSYVALIDGGADQGGTSAEEYAAAAGLGPADLGQEARSLSDILASLGVTPAEEQELRARTRNRYLAALKVAFAREAIASGHTHEEVGEFLGVSRSAVSRLLSRQAHEGEGGSQRGA
jgi:REP element-mobilizing transposase RayT